MQLVSTNLAGNIHVASDTVNKMGLADCVVFLESTGHATIVVFRVTNKDAPVLRKSLGHSDEYLANPTPATAPHPTRRDGKYGVFGVPGGWAYRHFGLNAPVVGPFKDKAEAMRALLSEVGFDVE